MASFLIFYSSLVFSERRSRRVGREDPLFSTSISFFWSILRQRISTEDSPLLVGC
ncbi:hypothetical protein HYC85_015757 [Camellia sinensis]|uniref:Uncharacterized protein n=1 Tax=Camellia sinensis TaxID=4442 RepID=A0A7J7GXU0_CAMSI|nr:hypothetical protein HYC85_015757 [Camellia sinensis]